MSLFKSLLQEEATLRNIKNRIERLYQLQIEIGVEKVLMSLGARSIDITRRVIWTGRVRSFTVPIYEPTENCIMRAIATLVIPAGFTFALENTIGGKVVVRISRSIPTYRNYCIGGDDYYDTSTWGLDANEPS